MIKVNGPRNWEVKFSSEGIVLAFYDHEGHEILSMEVPSLELSEWLSKVEDLQYQKIGEAVVSEKKTSLWETVRRAREVEAQAQAKEDFIRKHCKESPKASRRLQDLIDQANDVD